MLWYQTILQISVAYKNKGFFFSHTMGLLWASSSFVLHAIHSGTLGDGAPSLWNIADYRGKGKEST